MKGSSFMAGVSIVIPTLNEVENIDPLLQRIFKVELQEGCSLEIIIVDDSPTEDTRVRVLNWTESHPVRLVCRSSGGGLASAVIAGAFEASHEIVLVMDADLSHPPERIPDMTQPLLDGSHDMVIGSRYVDGGATPEWPFSRKFASMLATVPARLFSDANDPMAGFFATSRTRLTSLSTEVSGFKIGLELLAAGGDSLRVREIPIIFYDRVKDFSKMNKGVIFDYLKQVLRLSRISTESFSLSRLATLGLLGVLIVNLFFTIGLKIGFSSNAAHLSALSGSGVFLFLMSYHFWQRTNPRHSLCWRHWFCGLLALILSMSLQGAVFLLFQQYVSFSETAAIIPASFVGTFCFLGILAIYVFSGFHQLTNGVRLRLGAMGTILFMILFRLVYLGLPELMEQEAYYWNYSRHMDFSYLDHPPMAATLIWFGTALFGTTEFGVRLGAFLCWFITAFFSYRLTCRIFGRTAALGAILLVSLLPLYFGAGFIMTPDAPLSAAWSALLYFLYRALVDGRSTAWVGVGISLGCGMISKYTIVLLGPAIICFMLIDRDARRWFVRVGPYGAVLLALLVFSPVLIWNYQHEWVSFLFQGEHRAEGKLVFTTHRLIGYLAAILTPAGILSVLYFFLRGNRFFKTAVDICRLQNGRCLNRNYLFLLLMTLSSFAVFFVFSFTRETKLNWTSPLWLAAVPFIACIVMSVRGTWESKFLKLTHRLWNYTFIFLLITFAVVMHYATLGLPGIPHPSRPFLTGWLELAREIDAAVDRSEAQTGSRPVVVGLDHYQISSGIAFYRTKNNADKPSFERNMGVKETLGRHLFGWNSRMYRYWADPQDYNGRDIMVIGSRKSRVEHPGFQNYFDRMSPVYLLSTKKGGKEVRNYYTRLLYGYQAATLP